MECQKKSFWECEFLSILHRNCKRSRQLRPFSQRDGFPAINSPASPSGRHPAPVARDLLDVTTGGTRLCTPCRDRPFADENDSFLIHREIMEYNDNDYDYNDYPQHDGNGSVKGLKIAIIILLIVLAVISFFFWKQVQELKRDQIGITEERDTLTNRLTVLLGQMGDLKVDNDTMNIALMHQRHIADSLLDRLKKERGWNYAKIKKYERELGTLRAAMQGFVRQIDSLNRINQQLAGENMRYKRQITSLQLRTEAAEEMTQELNNKVKRASQLRARDVALLAYSKRNKLVSRAKQTEKLVTEFILTANEVAIPGERTVYVRVITPEADILGSPDGGRFTFAGESIPYTAKRVVDYQGDDLPVSIFYDITGLYAGQYTVMVYVDGQMVGQSDVILK